MVNAPTRHPPTFPGGRRPPRGPRPVTGSPRETLAVSATILRSLGQTQDAEAQRLAQAGDGKAAEAARQLAEQAFDGASAVDAVLAPRGYRLLQQSEVARQSTSNLPISLSKTFKDALEAAGKEFHVVFSGLAEEAYRKVRDEQWVPPQTKRSSSGSRGARSTLNLSIDDALRREVQAMLPDLSAKAGYTISEASIALSYICDELGIERPGVKGATDRLNTRVPVSEMQHFSDEAATRGLTLQEITEEGIRSLLAGQWTPQRNVYFTDRAQAPGWTKPGSGAADGRTRLSVPLDPDLLQKLRDKAADLSQDLGFMVHPGAVVRQILTKALGQPAE